MILKLETVDPSEPRSFKEAMRSPDADKWRTAMEKEVDGLQSLPCWRLVARPTDGSKIQRFKWVFTLKWKDGKIVREKARLAVMGNLMRPGIDYHETSAPTAKSAHMKAFFAVANMMGWDIDVGDVTQAFPQADNEDFVVCEQPDGFDDGTGRVCELLRSLYGMPQAGRNWYKLLKAVLQKLGFKCCRHDTAIFTFTNAELQIIYIIATHVDDLHGTGPGGRKFWLWLWEQLNKKWIVSNDGEPTQTLGITIDRDRSRGTLMLKQGHYIRNMLNELGWSSVKPADTPMDVGATFNLIDSPPLDEVDADVLRQYQTRCGALNYVATWTRPDIAYAVSQACAVMSRPASQHVSQLDRIAGYLTKFPDRGLMFNDSKSKIPQLELYVDANFSGEKRNTTGFAVMLGGAVISHGSQRQKHAATSTAMSEYHAAGSGVAMVYGIAHLLKEWGFPQCGIPVYEDNTSCIAFGENAQISDASKQIRSKYHFVRELIEEGMVKFVKTASEDQAADPLTKALPKALFHKLTYRIMGS